MFDRRLARPGTEDTSGLTRPRLATRQAAKNLWTAVLRLEAFAHGEKQLDPIAGGEINQLIDTECGPQCRQALGQLLTRKREPCDMPRPGVPVGKPDEPDL